jgi:hypothetical protein
MVSRAAFALRVACLGHVSISVLRRRSIAGSFLASPASRSNGRWPGFVRPSLTAAEEDAIALDGKTVRGAALPGQAAPHLLAFCTHASQETLLQVLVSEKTNEIPVAQAVLPCLALPGRVYTADALHTRACLYASGRRFVGLLPLDGEGKPTDLI